MGICFPLWYCRVDYAWVRFLNRILFCGTLEILSNWSSSGLHYEDNILNITTSLSLVLVGKYPTSTVLEGLYFPFSRWGILEGWRCWVLGAGNTESDEAHAPGVEGSVYQFRWERLSLPLCFPELWLGLVDPASSGNTFECMVFLFKDFFKKFI